MSLILAQNERYLLALHMLVENINYIGKQWAFIKM